MTASPVPADRTVRFLFVDDDAAILRALKEICATERDFTAETAEDAASALALIAARPPNVVVADQWMPGMDGVELLSQLRVTRPELVRVLLTGDPDRDVAHRALRDGGVHAIVAKPWKLRSLVTTLHGAAAQARMHRVAAAADPAAALRNFTRSGR